MVRQKQRGLIAEERWPVYTPTKKEKAREAWKDIPGWKGFYQVSNFGRVRSVDRWVTYRDGRRRFFSGKLDRCYRRT